MSNIPILIKAHQLSVCSIYDNSQHVTLFYFKKTYVLLLKIKFFLFLFGCLHIQSTTEPYFNPFFPFHFDMGPP